MQGLDYLYSINGWPKGVNSDSLDPTRDPGRDGHDVGGNTAVARDVFGSAVHYFPGDYQPAGLAGQSQTVQPHLRVATRGGSVTALSALALAGCRNAPRPDLCGLYSGTVTAATHAVTGFRDPIRGTAYRYDQLERLRGAESFGSSDVAVNEWPTTPPTPATRSPWRSTFDYDANGNITRVDRTAADPAGTVADGVAMDNLIYHYQPTSNRLLHIEDTVLSDQFPDDLDSQGAFPQAGVTNYAYDESGRLTRDSRAGLNAIRWDVGGRVRSIDRAKNTIEFVYDGLGHRIAKITRAGLNASTWRYEFFVRDQRGEILATYRKLPPSFWQTESRPVVVDQTIRGTQRLGILKPALASAGVIFLGGGSGPPIGIIEGASPQPKSYARVRGAKQYELANYVNNVYATITDRKREVLHAATNTVTHYEAEVVNRNDYDPFGSWLPGRSQETVAYRYGFSGLERDDELKGSGNSYYTHARLFDSRIGRWLSPDPLESGATSSYVGFANNPLRYSDPQGTADKDAIAQSKWEWFKGQMRPFALANEGSLERAKEIYRRATFPDLGTLGPPETRTPPPFPPGTPLGQQLDHLPVPGFSFISAAISGDPKELGEVQLDAFLFTFGSAVPRPGVSIPKVRRGKWWKGTKNRVHGEAEVGPTGGRKCSTCPREFHEKPGESPQGWQIDHEPHWADREAAAEAVKDWPGSKPLTRKEQSAAYQEATRLRCPTCNQQDNAPPVITGVPNDLVPTPTAVVPVIPHEKSKEKRD